MNVSIILLSGYIERTAGSRARRVAPARRDITALAYIPICDDCAQESVIYREIE